MLEIRDLHVQFHGSDHEAVRGIDLTVGDGEIVGLVGESGSGKTVTAMMISGLLRPEQASFRGQILLDGRDLLTSSGDTLRSIQGRDICVVFQEPMSAMDPTMRIGPQVEECLRVHTDLPPKRRRELALQALRDVDLPDAEDVYRRYPHELSGGMMQRFSIVLSLMFNPDLLIMDEATTALDVGTQGQLLREIMKLEAGLNLTRIMITHDLSVVASACRKTLVLYSGQVMEFGTVEQVIKQHLHPYTEGLIRSFPSLYGEKQALRGIPGSLPDLTDPPKGCVFAPRCPYATERCRQERPQVREYEPGHFAACHRCQEREVE